MEILSVKNFSFTYSGADIPALKNINISVSRGEILLLYGMSGCGKTTLLRLIKPETAPKGKSQGTIERSFNEAGYVFQNPEMQIVADKVWHELAFACENKGWSQGKIRRRVGEIAEYFGLTELFRRDTATLSGGQKQLLNLAAVMVTEPEVLLLDEPTAQLDPIAAESFIETVHRLNRDFGITVIMCEHNTDNSFARASRAAYMEKGEIRAVLPPRELCSALVGSPMFHGLPCAARIGAALRPDGPVPLTTLEGRTLINRYGNEKTIDKKPRPLSDEVIMEAKDISFRRERGGAEILRGIDLKIHQGEIISVLGGNGAGKSTLLSVLCGLLPATAGKIKYMGKSLKSYGPGLHRGNIAMLPQNPQNCFTQDTLRADWEQMAELTEYEDIAGLARRLDLEGLMDSHPYDLSGGEQQKAALGKVLMQRPRLLLLDEPGKGLDAINKKNIMELIRGIAAEGTAVVLVTHDTELAAELSHRCALLFDGELISLSEPEEFFGGNIFYTTPAARISRGHFSGAVTAEIVAELCRINGERHE